MKKKINKTLRAIFSLVLVTVCCVASIPPIQTKAKTVETTIDFSKDTDDALFSTTYGDWSISNGAYKANTAYANAYLTEALSMESVEEISFDFCLKDDNDASHQFNVGLVNVSGTTFSGGVTAHFYYSSQWSIELGTLNSDFNSATGGTWYADTTTDYYDGQKHTMTIAIENKTASYKIDGNEVFTSASIGLDSASLIFQATSTESWIDNVKIKSTVADEPTPQPPVVTEYRNAEIDFEKAEDKNAFATTYGGWSISEGKFKADVAWANTYLNGVIPLDKDKEISFDFCLKDDNAADHQFKVGLVNISDSVISGGASTHFYYHSGWSIEMGTLNSDFSGYGSGTWYADTTTDYYDGQTHTMTITIENKTASYKIDGNEVFTSAEIGLDSVYLIFQATSTEYAVDNIKIVEVPDPEPTPQPPAVPEYSEQNIDFDAVEDGDVFATTYEGWAVDNGVYKANAAWANTYLNCLIPLDEDKEISFDFCLNNNGDANHQFNFGFVDINGSAIDTKLAGHFYRHTQFGELLTLNRDFGNPIGNGWLADNTNNYNDGELHTMMIRISDGMAAFYIDGSMIFQDITVEATESYFIMQMTSVDSYIDNFKVSDTLSQLPTNPENPSNPSTPTKPEVNEYKEVAVDFDVAADGDVFASTYGGWIVENGVYKASTAWANTYLNCLIPLNENKEISFDFCLNNQDDKNHQFNLGFIDINGNTLGEGLAGHFYYNTKYGELFTLNKDFGNPIGKDWIADNTDNYNDGKLHTMLIRVENGKATFCIDKTVIFKEIAIDKTSAYFVMQFTSTDSYIDNFRVSDTLTDIGNYAVAASASSSQSNASGNAAAPYSYREMTIDFNSAEDGNAFATTWGGWVVEKGVYKASTAWANAYLNCEIPLSGEKEISFDFCLKNNEDKNHQFNIGFVTINGDKFNTGLAGHFYRHAQYGELFTLNKDFGNPIGEGWIADNMDNFNDGEVHNMMIRIKDGKVAFYIDGNEIFKDIALDMTKGYFIMQFTSVDSYIDNFRVSDTLTYIPDYPVSTPDPSGDETVKLVKSEDSLVPTNGKVVRGAEKEEGISTKTVGLWIGGISGVALLVILSSVIILKKKKQVAKDE